MKKRLSVLINEELLTEFKKEVLSRYGKLYEAMGLSVEEALKDWLKKKNL